MRARKTPQTLEVHRLKFHSLGRRGPLIKLNDLSDEEKQTIQDEVMRRVKTDRAQDAKEFDEVAFNDVYMEVLSDWGVICPHPYPSIVKDPKKEWYSCQACGCAIFPTYLARQKARAKR